MIDRVIYALLNQSESGLVHEIIVVGQDENCLVPPNIRFIETPYPASPAKARNIGARHATAEWLLFIDDDCIASVDLVSRYREAMSFSKSVLGGGVQFNSKPYWSLCDNLLVFTPFLTTQPRGAQIYLPSLNLCVRRDVFMKVGGFDENFPHAAGEDVDLSMRLRRDNNDLHFEPTAWVTHRPSRATARLVWQHLFRFGEVHPKLAQKYSDLLPSKLNSLSPIVLRALKWFSPFLALRDILILCAQNASVRAYPHTFFGLWWGKIAWYWGVTQATSREQAGGH
jgi:GT2 family glycosyltransferase